MRVETTHYLTSLEHAATCASGAEQAGYDTWWATEVKPDVFLACAVAARETQDIRIGTGVAVALARTPMTVAVVANDLHQYSGGRFVLGLGSQVKAHITKRFSMPYTKPAKRMREFILATRAIWEAWQTGGRLDFQGEFYSHTLMTPMFDPGPSPVGHPPIHLAAVGPLMTEVAGEVADGISVHGFSTQRYLREVTLPALERGAARAGRSLDGFELNAPGFVAVAETDEQRESATAIVKGQIGFYGSTPAYRGVLDLHGWDDLGEELTALSRSGGWDRMAAIIPDEVLAEFSVIGTVDEVAGELRSRYGDVATRVLVPELAPDVRQRLAERLAV